MIRIYRQLPKSVLAIIICLFAQDLRAQEITVVNPNFEPLIGATLGNTDGKVWVTKEGGKVQLNLQSSQLLTIQYLGYESVRLLIEPDKSRTIMLPTLPQKLNDVVVEGFADDDSLAAMAGSIAKLTPADLQRFDQFAIVSAVNTIPGVQLEQRAESSYRVSIRGSSIRSPFGVRNVKVYWNGIPFTEPGGNTFLNLLDLSNISDIEIIKGPAGSAYGAGNGGVIKLKSTDYSALNNATQFSSTLGSFGSWRGTLSSNVLKEKFSLTAKYSHQDVDGYRDHNETQRKVGEFDFKYFPDSKQTYSLSLFYSDLFYEIPGGLNPDQLAENRRQARPRSEPFNASIDHQFFLIKGGQEYRFSESFRSNVQVYASSRQFENPFILDYKRDEEKAFGLRLELENDFGFLGRQSQITYGTELQQANVDARNFGNVAGRADTIRFYDQLDNTLNFWFADAKLQLGARTKLTAGVSLNYVNYQIDRIEDEISNNTGTVEKNFESVVSPRVAISQSWSNDFSTHFSISHGYSPPTTTEVRTNEGTLNLGLAPEIGVNYELNLRGNLINDQLSFDVAAFYFQLDESITTETNPQGVVLFRNSGQIDQRGLEASLVWDWLPQGSAVFSTLKTRFAYTHHDFQFKNYVDGGEDLSGKALPGTSPNILNVLTDIEWKKGWYANLSYRYSDQVPLNDQNSIYANDFHLVQTRIGYRFQRSRTNYEIFAGVNNLLNEEYSLGNDLNAFGQRYFQPAPARNVYLGFTLKLNH